MGKRGRRDGSDGTYSEEDSAQPSDVGSEDDDGFCSSECVGGAGDVQRQRRGAAKPSKASAAKPASKRQKRPQAPLQRRKRPHGDLELQEGDAAAAAAAGFGEARLTDDLRTKLSTVEKLSKRKWTKTKYKTQDKKFLWYCEHNEDGTKRTPPFDPSLASGDLVAKATGYMWWIARNCPGFNYANKPDAMGKSTAKQVHAALQLKFQEDHLRAGKELPAKNLLEYVAYQTAQSAAHKAGLTEKGERTDRDPQAGTMEDTVNADQMYRLGIVMLGSSKRTAPRDMSMALWSCQTIGRSDDARLLFIPDLLPPVLLRVLGPSPSFLVSAVLRGGKRQVGGKVAYAGCIRTKDPLLCAQGALGRSLACDYTLDLRPFPLPTDRETWLHKSPLWIGGRGGESVSYTQQWEAVKEYFVEACIHIRKATHAWRFFKARDLDEQGVSDDLIARLGRWLRTALNTSYLRFFKPEGLLAAGGWDKDRMDAVFAERFCIDVPEELVDFVFPCLQQLKKAVQELGDDNDLPSGAAVLKNLQYLAVVLVQDACALLTSSDPDVKRAAEANRVHKHLLTNQLFRDTLKAYQTKMEAGGYDMLRPLSTREHVQQLAAGLSEMRAMLQERNTRVLEQMRKQRRPRSMEDEEQEQQQQWDALLAKAATARGLPRSSVAGTTTGAPNEEQPAVSEGLAAAPQRTEATEPEGGGEPAPDAGQQQQQQSLQEQVAQLRAQVAALTAQLQHRAADPGMARDADDDSTAGSPLEARQTRRLAGRLPDAAAAAAADPVGMLTSPFQSVLDSSSSGPPQQPHRPAVVPRPAVLLPPPTGSAMLADPFRGMMGKLQARQVLTAGPTTVVKADGCGSAAAAVAATAAAQAVAATGADGAAVAAAAAQAAVQALAQAASPAAPAVVQPEQEPPSDSDASAEAGMSVARAMPMPGSFKMYGSAQVEQLWAWYTAPYGNGPSVQQRESDRETAWRDGQKNGAQRWRQLNLVLRRVAQRQHAGSCVLSGSAAAKEVDQERIRLGMTLPQFVKHLEKEAAKAAADAAAAAGDLATTH